MHKKSKNINSVNTVALFIILVSLSLTYVAINNLEQPKKFYPPNQLIYEFNNSRIWLGCRTFCEISACYNNHRNIGFDVLFTGDNMRCQLDYYKLKNGFNNDGMKIAMFLDYSGPIQVTPPPENHTEPSNSYFLNFSNDNETLEFWIEKSGQNKILLFGAQKDPNSELITSIAGTFEFYAYDSIYQYLQGEKNYINNIIYSLLSEIAIISGIVFVVLKKEKI